MNTLAIKVIIILSFIFYRSTFAQHNISSNDTEYSDEQNVLDDDYYKKIRKYERNGILANCSDTLNTQEQEVDPRYTGGFSNIIPNAPSNYLYLYAEMREEIAYKHEETSVYTNDDGTKTATKRITCKGIYKGIEKNIYERNVTIYNKKGIIIHSKHYTWNGSMLVQTIDDGIVRNIIPGKTRCNFTVIEPSGDSISFNLDPKKKLDTSIKIRGDYHFSLYMKNPEFKIGKYDAIVYQWHSFCKR